MGSEELMRERLRPEDTANVPRLLKPKVVAEVLGISVATVERECQRRRLGYVLVGRAKRITEDQLNDYIRYRRIDPCRKNEIADQEKSVNTGSRGGRIARSGAEPGSIESLDRRDVHRLAQRILSTRR